jgi:CO/xanthine dehydrogenase Mo-binding subunit
VTLVLGTVDLSATRTSLAMVAAEALGLKAEDVRVVVGDTDMVAYSGASAGDKITYVTSKAVLKASQDLLTQLKARAAAVLGGIAAGHRVRAQVLLGPGHARTGHHPGGYRPAHRAR